MSIITQALKKAQREQDLHQAPTTTPKASAAALVSPRPNRPRPVVALGGVMLLGTGACIYMWLIHQPASSRGMLASTSQQSSVWLNPPSDEAAQISPTALAPQAALVPPVASPRQVTASPVLIAVREPMPVPAPTEPGTSQATAAIVPPPPAPTSPPTDQAIGEMPLPRAQHLAKRRFNEALEAMQSQALSQAEQLLLQAITLNPDMKVAYTSLGNLYYERQDYGRAIAMYQHALSIDPQDVKARNNLGSSYMQLAMHDKAIAELHKAIEMDNTSGLAYYNLACAYARTGAPVRAIEYLQQAVERLPQARHWARTDSDFASVRSAPAFQQLLGASS